MPATLPALAPARHSDEVFKEAKERSLQAARHC